MITNVIPEGSLIEFYYKMTLRRPKDGPVRIVKAPSNHSRVLITEHDPLRSGLPRTSTEPQRD